MKINKGELLKGIGNILIVAVPMIISSKKLIKQSETLADEIIKFAEKVKS